MAGSNEPSSGKSVPTSTLAMTEANDGSTRCVTPSLFSVVRSSSASGSADPAPTPSAYSIVSRGVQDRSIGPRVVPTAALLIGTGQLPRTGVKSGATDERLTPAELIPRDVYDLGLVLVLSELHAHVLHDSVGCSGVPSGTRPTGIGRTTGPPSRDGRTTVAVP